jgi:hypothetical protein
VVVLLVLGLVLLAPEMVVQPRLVELLAPELVPELVLLELVMLLHNQMLYTPHMMCKYLLHYQHLYKYLKYNPNQN